jgi:tRNA threonylcarbamoyladenosine biosynthesis protein TsaB
VSIILNIETAVQSSSICLAENELPISVRINPLQKDSAAWIHLAIDEMLEETGFSLQQLDAIAVSAGPGSYTGLRVAMATAKGLCYALNIPLIAINTLKIMAYAAKDGSDQLLCPMIDARRMEVFAAVFDQELNELVSSTNIVLEPISFHSILERKKVLFFGNGSTKFQAVISHPNAAFKNIEATAKDMITLTHSMFEMRNFVDLAYAEPFYGKDFHSTFKQSL